ncbi:MAG: hypothetical protein PWP46_1828 [Fusobacteriaceae bacterium]|jgi:hypothetical protein|nr:hypothetical protein [Fusobacteriaceae bacterium]
MINLPNSCIVDRFIPKSKFYEKKDLNSNLIKKFQEKIKKITWKYKISEESVGIEKDANIKEIQIFEIELKTNVIPIDLLKIIDSAIPYIILYKFTYKNNFAYGIALKKSKNIEKYFLSDWNEDINFDFSAKNLKICYENIIKKFIKKNIDLSLSFEKIIEIDNKLNNIDKNLEKLKKQLNSEKQFNKKAEIHEKIKELENLKKSLLL